jgi:hypothetical protein
MPHKTSAIVGRHAIGCEVIVRGRTDAERLKRPGLEQEYLMVTETSRYGIGTTVALDYERAVESIKQSLAAEGFGILCEIDVAATM